MSKIPLNGPAMDECLVVGELDYKIRENWGELCLERVRKG